jgi:lipoprotein-anchoring transpeptidase ErfK/SrfK
VADKHVIVDMERSVVTALENGTPVFEAVCATGTRKPDQYTPGGTHKVLYKSPATHMRGDLDKPADRYDLPGVAYSTFFTTSGVALHGTFWHNDWGARRSHGCVNLKNEDARWFFRWTGPNSPYEIAWYFPKRGATSTRVTVRY